MTTEKAKLSGQTAEVPTEALAALIHLAVAAPLKNKNNRPRAYIPWVLIIKARKVLNSMDINWAEIKKSIYGADNVPEN